MSHTPGPWEVGDKRGVWVGPVVMAGNGSRGVAFVCGESDANARLIAAAPDMLAALEVYFRMDTSVVEFVDAARAAVIKATGGGER